jgi:type III restriction enzyme
MTALDVDLDILEAVAGTLDLREPNKEAVQSIAFEIAQHYDVDSKPRPFEGVVDSATGVGKTYVFAGAVEYLAQARGVRNFVLIAPSRVILSKTIEQFTAGHRKSLLGDMNAPVTLVTVGNFDSPAMAALMDDDSRVKVYVFTVQALLKPKKKSDKRTHTFQEGLGAGLYDRLKNCDDLTVFADEHHAYYGPEFSTAIRDLHPWALVGLTATPHKRTPEDSIIFRYPLAAAIADQYVKTRVIVGRKDDKHDPTTKLLDGVTLLEHKRQIAERHATVNNLPRINPVMLVVARDITEAGQWADVLRDNAFQGGSYRDAVLVVHSRTVKEDHEDAELRRLTDIEDPASPIRVVISVAMLKEGWDVKNVYVLLSTQPSLSDILTEQVLGRGLRLPWGKYTGVEMLDTLEVLAHDRFEDLLRRRQVLNESFIDHRTRAVLRLNAQGEQVVVRQIEQVSNPVIALPQATEPPAGPAAEAVEPEPSPVHVPGQPGLADAASREQVGATEVARMAQDLAPRQPIWVPLVKQMPIISHFSLTDITDFEQFRALGRRLRVDPDETLRRTLVGAKVITDASGVRRTELVTSTAADTVKATGLLMSSRGPAGAAHRSGAALLCGVRTARPGWTRATGDHADPGRLLRWPQRRRRRTAVRLPRPGHRATARHGQRRGPPLHRQAPSRRGRQAGHVPADQGQHPPGQRQQARSLRPTQRIRRLVQPGCLRSRVVRLHARTRPGQHPR